MGVPRDIRSPTLHANSPAHHTTVQEDLGSSRARFSGVLALGLVLYNSRGHGWGSVLEVSCLPVHRLGDRRNAFSTSGWETQ